MRRIICLLPFLLPMLRSHAQVIVPDSIIPLHKLGPIVIIEVVRRVEMNTGHSTIQPRDLHRNDDNSIESALAMVPGLRYESRGPGGSRRLTLRGSLLRSPFGVRGLKVYLDGLPLSSPDGNTPLELTDPATIGRIDVLRGPHCGLYGPGTGGLLLMESGDAGEIGKWGGTASFTLGGYGYLRALASLSLQANSQDSSSITYIRQRHRGYRDQEANEKHFLQVRRAWQSQRHPVHSFSVNGMLYRGSWELPGALEDSIAEANPRSALPYSEFAQAAVYRDWARMTVSHTLNLPKFSIFTGAYLQGTKKLNPYGSSPFFQGYKDDQGWALGGRSGIWFPIRRGLFLSAALEGQMEPGEFLEYENAAGEPGALRSDNSIRASQGLASTELSWYTPRFSVFANGSLNLLNYNVQDRFGGDSIDFSNTIRFQPLAQYSLTLNAPLRRGKKQRFSVSVASAYSPPGLWEIVRENGSLDTELRAEKGTNVEVRQLWYGRDNFRYHIALQGYHFWLRDAILPFTDSLGLLRYMNAARAVQRGIELEFGEIRLFYFGKRNSAVRWVEGRAAFAFQDYRFREYTRDSMDLSGKRLPGIPIWTAAFGLDFIPNKSITARLTTQVNGPAFLNDANDVQQRPYALLNFRIEGKLPLHNPSSKASGTHFMDLTLFAGGNNLLNARYSNYLNLNDARGRYWNPAPGIHFYGGIETKF